jgi:hypothetical protein
MVNDIAGSKMNARILLEELKEDLFLFRAVFCSCGHMGLQYNEFENRSQF